YALPTASYLRYLVGSEEPEVLAVPRLIAPGGTAVDVGAHLGFYTRALALLCDSVHAFEPNTDVLAPLLRWKHPAVRVHVKGLSSRKGPATLYTPVANGVTLTGWASLDPGWLPSANSLVSQQIELDYLDSYGLKNVRLIKIDVEGSELDVL